ncbi:MAG TPA: elongation factor G [Anaerolineae bacterium]|nr:elongation factor G [Anaerolineae bacterium]HQH38000.1 elongation factor G [Anaerolineae bacterium]
MKEYTTQKIRNIALIGHGSSGKTTWTEAVLFLSKATNRRGKVEDGTTVTDFDEEEIRRRISLSTALAPVEWNGYKINILDTPGYTDFVGEVRSALRVADAAVVFVDAAAGVEVGTELTWGYAEDEKLPKVVLINKMDRENANFDKALQSLSASFSGPFLPMLLPIGAQADFKGVVNVLEKQAYLGAKSEPAPVPAGMVDQVNELYTKIVEAAVEADEALMEKYFADEPLTAEEISAGLRKVISAGAYVPVLATAGGSDMIGLGAVVDLLIQIVPAPDDHTFTAVGPSGEEELAISDLSPLALLVFKTTADPYVGKLTYFRVYGGVANAGDTVYNSRAGVEERLGQTYVMRGKEQIPVERLHAGDIGSVAKMNETLTGDTLCARDHVLTLRGPLFPHPLYTVAVLPKTKGDTAKMVPTLARICEEDPTLHWHQDPTTRETILAGMGDAHVETAVRRIQSRFGVGLETKTPKVPYKETITATNTSQYRHKKQSGGAGQFAEVHMRVEPKERDSGFQYEWEVFGGRISSSFRPSIEKGIKSVMSQGIIAGYPIVDVLVAITDGKEHPVDSKDIAFQIAGREGFKQAFLGAKPVLLEPIYNFVITVPEEYAGAVMSDLNTRRARVQGMGQAGKKAVITALAPLAEMLQYATHLRAITQGRGVYSMELSHYDVVPAHLTPQIIEQAKIETEE